MHLIVLRRNNVPVPEALPSALVPRVDSRYSTQAVTTDLVDLGADMFSSGTSADFNFAPKTEPIDPYDATKAIPKKPEERQPSLTPPKTEAQVNNKEWTKFVDSPTSSVSSPGPKPVNFDFHKSAVERDPKIFHPVAVRVTPDNNALPLDTDTRSSTSPRRDDFAHAFELASPKRLNSQPPAEPPPNGAEIKSIQRPQPRKPVKPAGVLPPPPARDDGPASLQYAPKKEPPPPPPPRPLRNHARSSSLDLNRLKGAPAPPPQPPPRASPSTAEPPRRLINQRSEGEPAFPPDAFAPREYEEGLGYVREMHGAFEVYRKPRDSSPEPDVRALSEQNAVLHRVCRALCNELADVTRDREALRVRLDQATLL